MIVEAFIRKIMREEDVTDGVFRIDGDAGADSGNMMIKSRRFGMDDSVFIRRIWYDTIYARRHK